MSAEEARGLLEGATPGPWRLSRRRSKDVVRDVSFPHDSVETIACVTDLKSRALVAAAPALARAVIALSEERDEASRERDRLRDILACERGERAPEGWVRDSKFSHNWSNPGTDMRVDEVDVGKWQAYRWLGQHDLPVGDETPTALEAIEQADKAAGVERG